MDSFNLSCVYCRKSATSLRCCGVVRDAGCVLSDTASQVENSTLDLVQQLLVCLWCFDSSKESHSSWSSLCTPLDANLRRWLKQTPTIEMWLVICNTLLLKMILPSMQDGSSAELPLSFFCCKRGLPLFSPGFNQFQLHFILCCSASRVHNHEHMPWVQGRVVGDRRRTVHIPENGSLWHWCMYRVLSWLMTFNSNRDGTTAMCLDDVRCL